MNITDQVLSSQNVTVLIHTKDLIRDCWFENGYFVIRQMKAGQNGMELHENKMFRMSREEMSIIKKMFDRMVEPL